MPISGVGHAAADIGHHRERRVHDDDARHGGAIEMVVDLGRIEACERNGRKESGEKIGAGLRQLIEVERGAGNLGEDREQTGPGGGFEHAIGRPQRCRRQCGEAQRDRR